MGKHTISCEEKPFPHIRVESEKGVLMFDPENLLQAKRMIDGLSRAEKKVIRSFLAFFA